ncbi:MoaD/ThiS family protein [Candidatus Bathyarchaeota archaeon]|nr:MoaD/ThiS family protein [Candidatus Bathyarchaeota archaeon]
MAWLEKISRRPKRSEMRVNVKYFATLREVIGIREEQIELQENSTTRDLLGRLAERHGPRFKYLVTEMTTGVLRADMLFLVDGTSMNDLQELETRLTDGCTVAFVPAVGGG